LIFYPRPDKPLCRAFFDGLFVEVATSKKPSHFMTRIEKIPYFLPKQLKNHTLWARTYLYRTYFGPGSLIIGFLHLLITLRIFSTHQHVLTYDFYMTKPVLSHFSEFWLGWEIILFTPPILNISFCSKNLDLLFVMRIAEYCLQKIAMIFSAIY